MFDENTTLRHDFVLVRSTKTEDTSVNCMAGYQYQPDTDTYVVLSVIVGNVKGMMGSLPEKEGFVDNVSTEEQAKELCDNAVRDAIQLARIHKDRYQMYLEVLEASAEHIDEDTDSVYVDVISDRSLFEEKLPQN